MKRRAVIISIIALWVLSCASLAERRQLDRFEETERGYRQALMASDFALAVRYMDPAVAPKAVDPEKFQLIKIVDYKPTWVDVSEDLLSIEQRVELKYYRVTVNLLRTLEYRQVWRFNEAHKVWILHTGLPEFNP